MAKAQNGRKKNKGYMLPKFESYQQENVVGNDKEIC